MLEWLIAVAYVGSNGSIVSKLYGQGVYFTPLKQAHKTLECYGPYIN